jgi:hypothetical protein
VSILLGILVALGTLATLFVGANVFSLRSSDAAGNALAQVFLAVAVIGLWLLIGITLVVAATRPSRVQLQWTAINLASVVLFFGAFAAQIAALKVLSGRNAEGEYRTLVQLAVIAAPTAALVHATWRGLGVPLPSPVATTMVAAVVLVSSVIPVYGIIGPARPPQVAERDPLDDLVFPALLIHNLTSAEIADSANDLRTMPTNHVMLATSEPFLIDSRLQIFVLRDLQLAKSTTGLLVRGQGVEPVTFRLVDWEPDGTPDAVRNVVLRAKWLNADREKDARIREKLGGETTLEGMIRVIREE